MGDKEPDKEARYMKTYGNVVSLENCWEAR